MLQRPARYASGLVLRRPVIRSPSFHWPRFFSSSVRSKRLRTFRFPPNVAAARRLRCCDINKIRLNVVFAKPLRAGADAVYSMARDRMPMVNLGAGTGGVGPPQDGRLNRF